MIGNDEHTKTICLTCMWHKSITQLTILNQLSINFKAFLQEKCTCWENWNAWGMGCDTALLLMTPSKLFKFDWYDEGNRVCKNDLFTVI